MTSIGQRYFANELNIQRADDIVQLLRSSDIISLHTNLTEETRDMICEDTIKYMKDGATLINCGRGELTNSRNIAAALESGKLGGYGADVLDQEPPARGHPLLGAKIVLSPHTLDLAPLKASNVRPLWPHRIWSIYSREKKHSRKSTTSSRLQLLSNLLLNAHFYVREILHRSS